MDGQPTWTDCDEAGDYVVPNVLSPRDLVFRPDNMDETVPHTQISIHRSILDKQNTVKNESPTIPIHFSNKVHLLPQNKAYWRHLQ